ncbi:hypothetical protein AAHE18_08G135000 [Arachis hypogaea]
MHRNSLSYANAIFLAVNIEFAYSRHAFPLLASVSFPSFTTASTASNRDSTLGENIKPNSSSTTIVPLILGNLDAKSGFSLIIASIRVRSSPCGLNVGLTNMSIAL